MSIISLQIGQCGNQIGDSFFSTLIDDINEKKTGCTKQENLKYAAQICSNFFTESEDGKKLIANSVQIDMERKVIQGITATPKNQIWGYSSCFYGDFGCGNNWASGFYGYGRENSIKIMDIIRKKVEHFDKIEGFVINMSVAGGTGSGLGSLVTKLLRDEYRHSIITNQVVWPFSTGEVSVQSYNTLLTLSSLYHSSDAIIVVENDGVRKLCSRYAGQYNAFTKNSMGFQMINKVISKQFASVILPAGYIDMDKGPTRLNHSFSRILECMTPDPDFKLLNIRSVPHASYASTPYEFHQWDGLVRYLRQMLASNSHVDQDINWSKSLISSRALSSMLFLRGNDIHRFNQSSLKSSRGNLFGAFGDSLTVWGNGRSFAGNDKFASVLTNGQSLRPSLERIVDKAWLMFAYRAFVHQYEQQGMEAEEFMRAFAQLELIIKNYSKL